MWESAHATLKSCKKVAGRALTEEEKVKAYSKIGMTVEYFKEEEIILSIKETNQNCIYDYTIGDVLIVWNLWSLYMR